MKTIAFSAGDPTGPSLPGDINMARRAAPVLVVGTQSSTRIWVKKEGADGSIWETLLSRPLVTAT